MGSEPHFQLTSCGQCWILNPLSQVRDQTHILTETASGPQPTDPQGELRSPLWVESDFGRGCPLTRRTWRVNMDAPFASRFPLYPWESWGSGPAGPIYPSVLPTYFLAFRAHVCPLIALSKTPCPAISVQLNRIHSLDSVKMSLPPGRLSRFLFSPVPAPPQPLAGSPGLYPPRLPRALHQSLDCALSSQPSGARPPGQPAQIAALLLSRRGTRSM